MQVHIVVSAHVCSQGHIGDQGPLIIIIIIIVGGGGAIDKRIWGGMQIW